MIKDTRRALLAVLIAAIIAIAAFAAGYVTRNATLNAATSSYGWAIDTIEKNYYYSDPDETYTETALSALAAKYLDQYSQYYTAEEYRALVKSNSGSKSGIGVTYSFVEGKGVYIASVIGNSPAYISGLRAGEFIKSGSVGGVETEFNSLSDFTSFAQSAGEGREITLYSFLTENAYTMAKSEYTASYAYMCTNSTSWHFESAASGGLALVEDTSEKLSCLPDGAAYINLSQFYGTAADETYALVEKFNAYDCKTLVLDLRSNGGGYVNVMQKIAGIFSGGSRKIAMVSRDKNGVEEKYYCAAVSDANKRISSDCEVYVLANSGTASASEALIGAMVCYGALDYENIFLSDYSDEYIAWYESLGQTAKTARSYGKGIMQTTFVNSRTGEALKLTTAKIYWPDGVTCIHDDGDGAGGGLTAAMGCRTVEAKWERTLYDEELQKVAAVIAP